MQKRLKKWRTVIDKLAFWAGGISIIATFAIAIVVNYDVVARFFFSRPFKGVIDVTEMLMLAAIFMGISATHLERGHVTADLVVRRLSKLWQSILQFATTLIGIVLYALMTWQLFVRFIENLPDNTLNQTATIKIPYWPFTLLAAIGIMILTFMLITDCIELFYQMRDGKARQEKVIEESA